MCYRKILYKSCIAIILCAVMYSCTPALYEPELKSVKNETLLSALKDGRKAYVQKCGNCHNLYLPEKYTNSEWEHWLGIMAKKAKLNETEKSVIFRYLTYEK